MLTVELCVHFMPAVLPSTQHKSGPMESGASISKQLCWEMEQNHGVLRRACEQQCRQRLWKLRVPEPGLEGSSQLSHRGSWTKPPCV